MARNTKMEHANWADAELIGLAAQFVTYYTMPMNEPDRKCNAIVKHAGAVHARMSELPATTLAGIAAKLRVFIVDEEPYQDPDQLGRSWPLLKAAVAELEALAAAEMAMRNVEFTPAA